VLTGGVTEVNMDAGMATRRRVVPRRLGFVAAILFALSFLALPVTINAGRLEFDLVFQTKCVFEDVLFEGNAMFRYNAYQTNNPDQPVSLSVRIHDPSGKEIFSIQEQGAGEKIFSSLEEGRHKICFTAKNYHTAQNTRVHLEWEEGVDATDWDDVAKRDHTDAVHTELTKLLEAAHTMHFELQHVRRKEEELRNVNEQTNSLVAFLSIGALVLCVGLAVFQMWSLRRFFKRKKVL
jgi:hypothetical protein